jgi:hypothetical protein
MNSGVQSATESTTDRCSTVCTDRVFDSRSGGVGDALPDAGLAFFLVAGRMKRRERFFLNSKELIGS